MAEQLLIGPVLLQDFELPERIFWGGRQRLAIHRLPGGRRVIDAMGRDDWDIAWQGVFTGGDAVLRARAIDLMRADGGLWPLTWGSFFYSVVVARFDADYARDNWIPYRIACTVLRDEVEAVVEAGLGVAGRVLGDLADAAGAGGLLDIAGLRRAVAQPSALLPGTADQGAALGLLRGQEAALEGAMAARGGALLGAGTATPVAIRAAEAEAGALAQLAAARGPLGRARLAISSLV
jgi:hypothetical protein